MGPEGPEGGGGGGRVPKPRRRPTRALFLGQIRAVGGVNFNGWVAITAGWRLLDTVGTLQHRPSWRCTETKAESSAEVLIDRDCAALLTSLSFNNECSNFFAVLPAGLSADVAHKRRYQGVGRFSARSGLRNWGMAATSYSVPTLASKCSPPPPLPCPNNLQTKDQKKCRNNTPRCLETVVCA